MKVELSEWRRLWLATRPPYQRWAVYYALLLCLVVFGTWNLQEFVYILDHHWRDEEQLLVRGRRAPDMSDFEPLPRIIERRR